MRLARFILLPASRCAKARSDCPSIEKRLAEREMQQHLVVPRLRAVGAEQSLHRRDRRIVRGEAFEIGAIEPGRGRTRERLHRAREGGLGLRRLAMFHEQDGTVDQRLFRGGSGQAGRAIIGGKRRVELAHRLQHEAMGVMGFRMVRCRRDRAARGIERRFQPVELLQRQGPRGQPGGMQGREGQQRIKPAQRFGVALPRGLDGGEIDIGVGKLRVEVDGAARMLGGASNCP